MSLLPSHAYADAAAREILDYFERPPSSLRVKLTDEQRTQQRIRVAAIVARIVHQVKLNTLDAMAERLGVGTQVGK